MVDVPQDSEVLGLFPMGSAVPHPDVRWAYRFLEVDWIV